MSISPNRILYEDDYLLAVNKLSGELVVRGRGKVQKLPLYDFLKKDYPGLKVLHRLDFETSGVVLFSKKQTKPEHPFVGARGNNNWKKTYRTIVIGRMKDQKGEIRKKLPARQGGLVDAITKYKVLKRFKDLSYIEAEIETGRHHQIRKHFASIGCPLVLDDIYGDPRQNLKYSKRFRINRFLLHAYRIELDHPVTGEGLSILAPMPDAFKKILEVV